MMSGQMALLNGVSLMILTVMRLLPWSLTIPTARLMVALSLIESQMFLLLELVSLLISMAIVGIFGVGSC